MRTIIVDDHPLYLDAVCRHISRAFRKASVQHFGTFDDAITAVGDSAIDLVLLDYSLNGIAGVRRMIDAVGSVPVVVMSGVATRSDVTACLTAGARGFLPKTMEAKVFTSAISLVLNGGIYAPVHIADMTAPVREGSNSQPFPPKEHTPPFTSREEDLLRLIAKGVSNKEIAQCLRLQEVTVKFYLTHLFRKLEVKNRSQAAVAALHLGYGQDRDVPTVPLSLA